MNVKAMETAFYAAFSSAIRKNGIAGLKRTSLFGSNDKAMELKKAA